MKRIIAIILIGLICLVGNVDRACAQVNEAAQLALNIQKLSELKSILTTLKKGFEVVSKGYNTVRSLTEGNFSLHKAFLDGLMQVSPTVKKYKKIPEIIEYQIAMVKECKKTGSRIVKTNLFNPGEVNYVLEVYQNIASASLKNLDELINIITANTMRMSDDERLSAIDRIHADMVDKLDFVQYFNESWSMMALGRSKEKNQVASSDKLFGIEN